MSDVYSNKNKGLKVDTKLQISEAGEFSSVSHLGFAYSDNDAPKTNNNGLDANQR